MQRYINKPRNEREAYYRDRRIARKLARREALRRKIAAREWNANADWFGGRF